MDSPLTLTGDDNTPAMPTTNAQVNHLRRLLAWMRCEYMLQNLHERPRTATNTDLPDAQPVRKTKAAVS